MLKFSNLSNRILQDCVVGSETWEGQIEAYSCKAAGADKKLKKRLRRQFSEVCFLFFSFLYEIRNIKTRTLIECGETDGNS